MNIRLLISLTVCVVAACGILSASTVTGFTQIPGALFYNWPSGANINPVTVGSVTVTPNPNPTFLNSSFGCSGCYVGTPDVPGDGNGFGSDPFGAGGNRSLLWDFSQPLTGFGATFWHVDFPNDHSATLPATIQVYSGLDGGGTLLGTVSDSGSTIVDFIGFVSTQPNIRSAVISAVIPSTIPNMGTGSYYVDGFAVSTVPEPMTIILTAAGLLGFGIVRRKIK